MGRKEGGSLFHQMINAPDVFVLSQRTDKNGEAMEVSFKTKESYLDWLHKAADYFKAQGIRRLSDIGKEEIQSYADFLTSSGKTASTIHSYLTPVCKATGVELAEIKKPLRHASEFTRSGGGGKANGGRPAELNAMIGIREDELRHLRGSDIKERDGVTYVIVRRGKGGKYREQKALLQQTQQKEKAVAESFRQLQGYAQAYRSADFEEKRRIVSALIERVTVSRGYEIQIQFRVGLDVLKEIEDEQ